MSTLLPSRVTPEAIEAAIVAETYFTAADGVRGADFSLNFDLATVCPMEPEPRFKQVVICVLLLRNAGVVVGVNHGPIDAAWFDADRARELARADAIRQLWSLEGYLLREQRHQASGAA